jgi:hypothetical protein
LGPTGFRTAHPLRRRPRRIEFILSHSRRLACEEIPTYEDAKGHTRKDPGSVSSLRLQVKNAKWIVNSLSAKRRTEKTAEAEAPPQVEDPGEFNADLRKRVNWAQKRLLLAGIKHYKLEKCRETITDDEAQAILNILHPTFSLATDPDAKPTASP